MAQRSMPGTWLDWNTRLADLDLQIPAHMLNFHVADLVNSQGDWNLQDMDWIPEEILTRFRSIPPPTNHDGADICLWPGSKNGAYSVAAGYNFLCNFTDADTDRWSNIWKLPTKERVRSFVWLLTHDRLLTNERKAKMHLCGASCHHCRNVPESTLHVIRDCPLALNVWLHLVRPDMRNRFLDCNLQEWINLNLQCHFGTTHVSHWPTVWATACHSIWTWRNRMVHEADFVSPWQPWSCILKEVYEYSQLAKVQILQQKKDKVTKFIRWLPPPQNWIKLNSNGSSNANCGVAGCGGLFRDHNGSWLGGYTKTLGFCSPHIAELWGVFEGLLQAKVRNIKFLIVEIDSAHIVDLLHSGDMGRSDGWCLLRKIRQVLASHDWRVNFQHCYKEANKCAHNLAHIGSTQPQDLLLHDFMPSEIARFISDDSAGTAFPRLIVV